MGITNLKIVGHFDIKTFSIFVTTPWPEVTDLTLYGVGLTARRFIDLASMSWPKLTKLDVEGNNFYVKKLSHRPCAIESS